MNIDIIKEGMQAYKEGMGFLDNPYYAGDNKFLDWRDGLSYAMSLNNKEYRTSKFKPFPLYTKIQKLLNEETND
jgi:hypothetical protein